ncbi:MAG: hypothetical protein ACR2JW_05925 [Thermomicrobiales bacterium]
MRRGCIIGGVVLLIIGLTAFPVGAAAFAEPAFQTQWVAGEAITTNFWGPPTTSDGGRWEYYKDAAAGRRHVQYFDKGRMEWTDPPGRVTNGLLPVEMIRGRVQFGDATFVSKPPPNIPIAGDPSNAGPTYATLGSRASGILAPAPAQTGAPITTVMSATGDISQGPAISGVAMGGYDTQTQHNVASAFLDYRNRAGLATIGLAISEPFRAGFVVSGLPKDVVVQVFERRVLTFTAANTPAFQVEMGNVGQHYYQWRYPPNAPPIEPPL